MALFGGATTNTSGSNASTSTSTGSNTSLLQNTPNIPQWYSTFLGSLPGQFQGLSGMLTQNTQKPLYGPQQQANFQNNLNQTQGQNHQQLLSDLASRGALNSGRAATAETNLALGGQQQLSNYLTQVPQLNAQYQQQNSSQLLQLLGQMSGFTAPINAFGSTQTGNSTANNNVTQTGTNTGVGQTNPNIAGGLAAGGIGAILGGLQNAVGQQGGSGGLSSQQIQQLIGLLGGFGY